MSRVLTAADLHAVKGNSGDFNALVFKQQRLRLSTLARTPPLPRERV